MAVIDIEYGVSLLEDNSVEAEMARVQEMEMVLQNSSVGHEYAVLALQSTSSFVEQEKLNNQLEDYKQAYFQARQFLSQNYPERLLAIEQELVGQRPEPAQYYHA